MPTEKVMVCVTEQKICERLIQNAIELLPNKEIEIFVLHVALKDIKVIEDPQAAQALEYLFEKSKSYGASLTVLKSSDIRHTLLKFAVDNDIDYMIMGETRLQNEKDSVIFKLKADLANTTTKIKVVPVNEKIMN